MKNFSAVILAAGAGTRMKSSLPKVLHELSGKSLIKWVIDAVSRLNPDSIVLVIGHKSNIVEESLKGLNVSFVYQKEQLGSAHAFMQAGSVLGKYNGDILVLSGDVPLIKTQTLRSLLQSHQKSANSITVLAAKTPRPFGYGRIIRNGEVLEKIVEEKDASPAQRQINEINSGIYCFDKNVWAALSQVKPNNAKKEYYITDTVAVLKAMGRQAGLFTIDNDIEIKGINSRKELSEAQKIVQTLKIDELLAAGITIINPSAVYISPDAKIGADTIIYPGAFIAQNVKIGKNCRIEGSSYISNSKIGNNVEIKYSYIEGAVVGNSTQIGPFSHIRPDSVLKENVKVGNFSEIKKSVIAKSVKINHLSYIGDAQIGEDVNVGAGTITCNYDGQKKHKTVIGSKSFIGSNVNFVAPVKIGKSALIAAGSTITRDVPSGGLAFGRARQRNVDRKDKKVVINNKDGGL
ncbi:MAG: bifunctional UDP-N-acetylglucosamine diphosphorylase/glucosamine-1-phosphate N-acetyltransferase GlmU [Elusimicrobiota bacterium]|jgi:bifunctional UDP-N-acetylglucosamine pyrophosphorylase/glucosamine-1-phosphate N-acetyltransferase|nr:bifunctional UDP-N-acetylglucosamine diphosphorylase/glucosamine-1-phosphate N-acetyltransferase GlmU [Elusimicrobiota bacterium]